jgi:hypothetical protein
MTAFYRYIELLFKTKDIRKQNEELVHQVMMLKDQNYRMELYIMRLEKELNTIKSKSP